MDGGREVVVYRPDGRCLAHTCIQQPGAKSQSPRRPVAVGVPVRDLPRATRGCSRISWEARQPATFRVWRTRGSLDRAAPYVI